MIRNIGVFINENLYTGGGAKYEQTIIQYLEKINSNKFHFIYFSLNPKIINVYKSIGINVILIKENIIRKCIRFISRSFLIYSMMKKIKLISNHIEKILLSFSIDLIYFISPNKISLDIHSINYIFTLWDLCHRDYPEFPEVYKNREYDLRENLYTHSLKKAISIITESEYNSKKIVEYYGIDKRRIKVIDFISIPELYEVKDSNNSNLNIKSKYQIANDYIFYPAQFWAHKNHIYILKAIAILKEKYSVILNALFSGGDMGNYEYVKESAIKLGVSSQVFFLGYVTPGELYHLYKQCLALVMPTYLGPTNIPPLEAMSIGIPVCYSSSLCENINYSDSFYTIDLRYTDSLVNALISIINNNELKENKINLGLSYIESSKNDFKNKLLEIFEEFFLIRELWK